MRIWMPWPCAVEPHARSYQKGRGKVLRSLTFLMNVTARIERETPRRKAVASLENVAAFFVAASVKLHGARPWHLREMLRLFCSRDRETPRRKAVASFRKRPLKPYGGRRATQPPTACAIQLYDRKPPLPLTATVFSLY